MEMKRAELILLVSKQRDSDMKAVVLKRLMEEGDIFEIEHVVYLITISKIEMLENL